MSPKELTSAAEAYLATLEAEIADLKRFKQEREELEKANCNTINQEQLLAAIRSAVLARPLEENLAQQPSHQLPSDSQLGEMLDLLQIESV